MQRYLLDKQQEKLFGNHECSLLFVKENWPIRSCHSIFFFSKQTNKQHGQYKIISKKVNFITEAAQQSSFWLSLVKSTPFSKNSFTISKHPIFIIKYIYIQKRDVKIHFDNNLQQTNKQRKKRKNSIRHKPRKAECDQENLDN